MQQNKFNATAAADLLIMAHRDGGKVNPPFSGPSSRDEAYRVQTLVSNRIGPVTAWKVGVAQSNREPYCAPLLQRRVLVSPATWPSTGEQTYGVESEVAYRLNKGFPPGNEQLSEDEIRDAISSIHVSIEVLGSRLASPLNNDPLWKLADNQGNGCFVYDPIGTRFVDQSMTELEVQIKVDGQVVIGGSRPHPFNAPFPLLVWMVKHAVTKRGGLPADTLITTGSYSGVIKVEAGAEVEVEFPNIGHTSLRIPSNTS